MEDHHSRYIKNIIQRNGAEARVAFQSFETTLTIQNVSVRSIFNYMAILERFLKWSRKRGLTVGDWSKKLAYQWVSEKSNPRTRVSYLVAVKKFFQALDYLDADMKLPKRPQAKLPDPLSEEEVLKLADACDNIRDRAMILATYEAAKRNHEIRGIHVQNVKFDAYGAIARFNSTKSNDSNVRLILSAKSLQGWLEIHGDRNNPEAYVFYGRNGALMSEENFRCILREAAKKAGIKRRVWPHLLRHSGIAYYKAHQVPDDDIMNITGHKDRRQLDRYGHITMAGTNERLLTLRGLQKEEKKKGQSVKKCRRCGFVNGPLSQYCGRCTLPLSEETVWRRDKLLADVELLTHLPGGEELFRDIVERAKARLNDLVREKKEKEVSSA